MDMFNIHNYYGPLVRLHWWLDVTQTKQRMNLKDAVARINDVPILKQFDWGILTEEPDHLVFILPSDELANVKRLLRMYHKVHKIKFKNESGDHVIGALCDDCSHEKITDKLFKKTGFKRSKNSDCVWVLGEA